MPCVVLDFLHSQECRSCLATFVKNGKTYQCTTCRRDKVPSIVPSHVASLSTSSPLLSPPPTYATHHWQLHDANPSTRAFAAILRDLHVKVMNEPMWGVIRGTMWQLDLKRPQIARRDVKLTIDNICKIGDGLMRTAMDKIGINESKLQLAEFKLLSAEPGLGQQPPHYDIEDYSKAMCCWSCLFYATPAYHTDVPIKSSKEMRYAFSSVEEVKDKKQQIMNALVEDNQFVSEEVQPGQIMVFRATVAHRGVNHRAPLASPSNPYRIVAYGLYAETETAGQGEKQRFCRGEKNPEEENEALQGEKRMRGRKRLRGDSPEQKSDN